MQEFLKIAIEFRRLEINLQQKAKVFRFLIKISHSRLELINYFNFQKYSSFQNVGYPGGKSVFFKMLINSKAKVMQINQRIVDK